MASILDGVLDVYASTPNYFRDHHAPCIVVYELFLVYAILSFILKRRRNAHTHTSHTNMRHLVPLKLCFHKLKMKTI